MTDTFRTFFLLIFVSGALILSGCESEPEVEYPHTDDDSVPEQTLTGTRMVFSEGGKISAVLSSNLVKVYEKENYTSLHDSMEVKFYNEEGEHTTTLTALSGEIWGLYEQVDSLRAEGDVLIISTMQKASLKAPAIMWNAATRQVFADGLVTLDSEDGFEQGTGFVAKDDLSEYRFLGPVYGEVRTDDFQVLDR